jgi:hypothetical protein
MELHEQLPSSQQPAIGLSALDTFNPVYVINILCGEF